MNLTLYKFLQEYGLVVENRRITTRWWTPVEVRHFFGHKLNEGMQGRSLAFPDPMIVRRRHDLTGSHGIQELFYCSAEDYVIDPFKAEPQRAMQPQPLAAAAHFDSARIVVWGSSYALSNMVIYRDSLVADYFKNTVRWLCARENRIAAPAKVFRTSPLRMTESDMRTMLILCLGVIPLVGVVFGFIAWIVRRK
jgi:hypothetical protein